MSPTACGIQTGLVRVHRVFALRIWPTSSSCDYVSNSLEQCFPTFSTSGTLDLALYISRYPWPRSLYLTVPLTSLFISHGTLDLALHISRYPWPGSSYLMVPLEENTYFFKLICFLIISYVRDKVVCCCWVSVYALINGVILFICFLFLHLAVPQGTAKPRLGITSLENTVTTPDIGSSIYYVLSDIMQGVL
jgi:hypothetical protein